MPCPSLLLHPLMGTLRFAHPTFLTLPLAAVWGQAVVLDIVDTAFAFMAIPTITSTLLLSPKVMAALQDYLQRMQM